MKKLILILMISIALMLAGCAELQVAKQTVKVGGAKLADDSLQTKLWSLCNASSYGSVKRWVGTNQDLGNALKTICNDVAQADIETTGS